MLGDRKFWFVPGTSESVWKISGEKSLLSMETREPFTGSQTPVLSSEKDKKAILFQENLGLKEGLDYEGHIVLKATSKIQKALVTLKWNEKSETVEISGLSAKYASYPLKFRSTTLVHDAVLSVEPVGEGKLWIGTVSLMPSDNIEGFRKDVITLLRELDSPVMAGG